MLIAWTSVGTRVEAEALAQESVARRLAACAQVDGPVTSHYWWEGKQEKTEEYRITFKALSASAAALEAFVLTRHPYAIPEWVVVRPERVAEKYLSWAQGSSSTPPP